MTTHGLFHDVGRGQADEEAFGRIYDQRVISRLAPYVRPYRRLGSLAVAAMAVYIGTQVAIPWLIKWGVDGFIVEGDFGGLSWVFGLFVVTVLLNWGSNYAQQLATAKIGQGVLYALRRDMFAHLQKLSLRFYHRTEVGRIMSRVQGDVSQLQEASSIVVVTLGDVLSLGGIVVAMLIMNLKLGLISMAVLPVLFIVMAVWQTFARRAFLRVRRAVSIVNGALNENISGVRVVQSMDRQDRNLRLFDVKNSEHLSSNKAASRLSSGLLFPVDVLTAAAIGLALFFGAGMMADDELEIGVLIAFVIYIHRFFDPVRNLTMQYTQIQRSMASGVRIFDLLDTEPDQADAPGASNLPPLEGGIEFRNVSFAYAPGEDVLRGVNLSIAPGETVAIVGPTGAGKTTLVSLLARFYDVPPDRGAVLVDGRDVRHATRRSLAGQMSMVLQEPFLFSGTVRDNIKYNRVDATDEQMTQAAKAVGAHDFVSSMEKGYDTFLEERGVNLSVGQRQLLSFARAVIADPRILILDEATANIDSHSEMQIQRALKHLLERRTAIVIAHRLSTIRGADKIVVLDRGEILEVGAHDALMERDGLYARLYRMNYASIEEPSQTDGGAR